MFFNESVGVGLSTVQGGDEGDVVAGLKLESMLRNFFICHWCVKKIGKCICTVLACYHLYMPFYAILSSRMPYMQAEINICAHF